MCLLIWTVFLRWAMWPMGLLFLYIFISIFLKSNFLKLFIEIINYYTIHEQRSGYIYIGITVCPSVCPSVCPPVCLSLQICVWLITFLWHRAKLEMPSASSHRKALKLLSNHRCQTVNASTETHASCNGVWILYLRPLLYNFNLNWEVNKKWMINIK